MHETRFAFGQNWLRFLQSVDEQRIVAAESALKKGLQLASLAGLSFLDIGCGSGLSSLAAARLGARVHSFDYDSDSVLCTRELKQRFAPLANWTIENGSALDSAYLRSLGKFEIVYSWGVLHHTGEMWAALENALISLADSGRLLVAIYNDQGGSSRRWRMLKRFHSRSGRTGKFAAEVATLVISWLPSLAIAPANTVRVWRDYGQQRGMSPWRDVVDWAGGYPFEVARPEEIFSFFRDRGLMLSALRTCGGGKGCNEFLFLAEARTTLPRSD